MTELLIPNDLAHFLKREIKKELMKIVNMEQNIDNTVERIFHLVNVGASNVIVDPKKKPNLHLNAN